MIIFTPLLTQAATTTSGTNIYIVNNKDANYATGDYQLPDAMALVVRVANIILQIVGVLTFAMFIYGGFMFLMSAGNQKTVSQAKSILLAAVVGLIIVFTSYLLVQFFIGSITGKAMNGLQVKK